MCIFILKHCSQDSARVNPSPATASNAAPAPRPRTPRPALPASSAKPEIFYHGTTVEKAVRIQEEGFKIPPGPGGLLGRGVYATCTINKATEYSSPGVFGGIIFELKIDIGKCKDLKIDDPMMKTWQKDYDSAWLPFSANDPSALGKQENCIKDPKRINIVRAIPGNTSLFPLRYRF